VRIVERAKRVLGRGCVRQITGGSFAALLLSLVATPAAAGTILLGQTVEAAYLYPTIDVVFGANEVEVEVGGGQELSSFAGFVDIDFSDTSILIRAVRGGQDNSTVATFDGLRFFDVDDSIPAFETVLVNPASTFSGFTASRISVNADTIWVNLLGLGAIKQGEVLLLDLVESGHPTPVPEPGSWLFLATAVAAILGWKRALAAP